MMEDLFLLSFSFMNFIKRLKYCSRGNAFISRFARQELQMNMASHIQIRATE